MPVAPTGYAHVRLTVTDLDRSRAFYDAVFGLPVAFEVPEGADQATREALAFLFGGIIYAVPGGLLLGLRPVAAAGDSFDEDRVGLDHLAFAVESEAALHEAVAVLEGIGATHSGIRDIGAALLLEFRDPDGIALELYAPAAAAS